VTTASYVVFHHPSVGRVRLQPGDLVGRLRTAALRIDHPHVSEAHAYLSLRDGQLQLLALRGGLALGGKVVREVTLVAGQQVQLAMGQVLEVVEVRLPQALLALRSPNAQAGARPELLSGRSLSWVDGSLVPRIVPDAPLQLWTDGAGWVARLGEGVPREVQAGQRYDVGPFELEVVEVPVDGGQTAATALDGQLDPPVRVEGYYDTVHLHVDGRSTHVIAGTAARLICELGEIGQPVHWAEVGRLVWPDESDLDRMRKKWDLTLIRLRRRLGDAGLRTDLVHPDGTGNVQLLLRPSDAYVHHA
jgi:hypothetical protein